MEYGWKAGSRVGKLDPQKVGERLEQLQARHGTITAHVVVQEAKKKASPLHNAFEWNNDKAAHEWRLHQARKLVGALVVRIENGDEEPFVTRAYVHIEDYEDVETVVSTPDKYDVLKARAFADFKAYEQKYRDIVELGPVFAAFEMAVAA